MRIQMPGAYELPGASIQSPETLLPPPVTTTRLVPPGAATVVPPGAISFLSPSAKSIQAFQIVGHSGPVYRTDDNAKGDFVARRGWVSERRRYGGEGRLHGLHEARVVFDLPVSLPARGVSIVPLP